MPQVRDPARAAVAARLTSVNGLLGLGPSAVLLAGRARGDWLRSTLDTATAAASDTDLAQLLAAADAQVRRAAFGAALRADRLDRAALLDAASHDADLVVRTRCAAALVAVARRDGHRGDLLTLAGSGTASIRADAVWALAALHDTDPAEAALLDRSPSVRSIAQAVVRRTGVDPVDTYRALVAHPSPDPAAVAGLGECGTRADAPSLTALLTDPRPRCRREAVRGLRLLGAGDTAALAALLDDPSAAVVRQVVVTVVHDAGIEERVTDLLAPSHPPYVRAGAYRLRWRRGTWQRVATDLELWDDPQLGGRARADLANWLNRGAATTYSMPTGQTRARLADLLDRRDLPRDTARLLRFHLGLSAADRRPQ